MAAADARLAAAERLLEEAGIEPARVTAAGHEREIAAVVTPLRYAGQLGRLAPDIKRLGFRYVAVDLQAEPELG